MLFTICCFSVDRDVFPYGIYMLAYEYLSNMLSNSEWVLEKKKQMKELQKNSTKYTYIDVSIPVVAGALAGMSNPDYVKEPWKSKGPLTYILQFE